MNIRAHEHTRTRTHTHTDAHRETLREREREKKEKRKRKKEREKKERERDTQRERERDFSLTHIHTHTHTHTHTYTHTYTLTNSHALTHARKHAQMQAQTHARTHTHTHKQTDRDRQRQTETHRDRQRQTETDSNKQTRAHTHTPHKSTHSWTHEAQNKRKRRPGKRRLDHKPTNSQWPTERNYNTKENPPKVQNERQNLCSTWWGPKDEEEEMDSPTKVVQSSCVHRRCALPCHRRGLLLGLSVWPAVHETERQRTICTAKLPAEKRFAGNSLKSGKTLPDWKKCRQQLFNLVIPSFQVTPNQLLDVAISISR